MRRIYALNGLLIMMLLVTGCVGKGDIASTATANTDSATLYPDYNTQPVAPDPAGMPSTAMQLAASMRLGWNVGNTMEASGGETAWGNPEVSRELIQLVKESGFKAIRLPVAWDQYASQRTAEINSAWLARVKEVVQTIVDADLYVIVNIHWDGGWLENNITPEKHDKVNARQKAYWQQIATALRDFDEHVIFASANEPHVENAAQQAVLLSYHQTFVDTVRATGGKNAYRVLAVQGPKTDIELTHQLWQNMPHDSVDDRLMMEVHYYTPYQFALMEKDEDWGKQFFYWGKDYHSSTNPERNATWGEEATVDQFFGLMKRQFVDNNIPVILGEFCATRRTGQLDGKQLERHLASRAYFHRYVTQQALANGMVPFYWDNGGTGQFACGLFDRDALAVVDKTTIDALMAGADL
ncbi:glycoside hydrolase family 5 protein [Alteromonas gilva]|uniref:Glycoside hydrolase family 5 protein n=1 Tax=Alteromonas gilva TaxID=2987522 RepID=A0ABT5KY03_9ALTE|nr:glycoside hydrolase family 5 protein [Alteromonas gilva]MDC8829654.1 glycoside hydrolase family 5 protein [Alteromonas gilva]